MLVVTGCAASLSGQPASAQSVGAVGELAIVGQLQGCRGSLQTAVAAPQAFIRRGDSTIALSQGDRRSIFLGDAFTVARSTDVRLTISDARFGRGAFVLAPEVLCSVRDADTVFRSVARPVSGSYAIRNDRDTLRFVVADGGAIIYWDGRGVRRLVVHIANVALTIRGTEFVVASDAASGTGYIYVREGLVGVGGASLGPNQLMRLPTLTPPTLRTANTTVNVPELVRSDIERHCRVLFCEGDPLAGPPRRVGKAKLILGVVGVAAVVGGGVCLSRDDWCGVRSTKRAGTLQVRIPL